MVVSTLLLFPHQLFEPKLLTRFNKIILVEHPIFYGFRHVKMKFNKKKIIFHRATCQAYCAEISEWMGKKSAREFHYITYENFLKNKWSFIDEPEIHVFEICDVQLEAELNKICQKIGANLIILQSPAFMNSLEQLREFWETQKDKKRQSHSVFYKNQLHIHNIKDFDKSYDAENRNPLPRDVIIPKNKIYTNAHIHDAARWCDKLFPNNPGHINEFLYPINRKDAKKWFNDFILNKLNSFGTYQDAIVNSSADASNTTNSTISTNSTNSTISTNNQNVILFHSLLSPLLNIGLITPNTVIKKTLEIYRKTNIHIRNVEAFVRQIIGWREYQRYLYIYFGNQIRNSNYFGNESTLTKAWYIGNTQIKAVDDAIKQAWNTGYLHHIQRLMIICNVMNLCEINPHDVYKWFMEYSIDSYDWVMVGNVYSMGLWADGGLSMRKPYISSSNYVVNMSGRRYKADPLWDELYHAFIKKHKKLLSHVPIA